MNQVLYRQYRPQTFAQVVGQEHVKITLKNAVERGLLSHAYLFTGSRGVGKTSLARILAKAANCLKPKNGEPCDKCDNCAAIREGRFLDLIEIDAASHTGVDNIREIIEHVRFSPASGKYKVIVIDEVHMLSKGAFNALLKTLEEPPTHAIFVLATTEISKVPATIVSRTQRFDFKRLSQADIVGQLEVVLADQKTKVIKEVLVLVARAAEGGMRDALSLLDQLLSFSDGKLTLEDAEAILGLAPFSLSQDFFGLLVEGKLPESLEFIKDLAFKGRDLTQFASGYLSYVEMVLNASIRGLSDDFGLTTDDAGKLSQHAQAASQSELVRMVEIFLAAAQRIKYSPIPQLPLELAAIEFIGAPKQSDTQQASASASPVRKPVVQLSDPAPEDVAKQSGSDNFTADINLRWGEFLNKVSEYNHSLIAALKLAAVVGSNGTSLTISFPYRFHKDAVEQRKNIVIIEKALEEVHGRTIKLKCIMAHEVLDHDAAEPAVSDKKPGLLEEAMKVFGSVEETV